MPSQMSVSTGRATWRLLRSSGDGGWVAAKTVDLEGGKVYLSGNKMGTGTDKWKERETTGRYDTEKGAYCPSSRERRWRLRKNAGWEKGKGGVRSRLVLCVKIESLASAGRIRIGVFLFYFTRRSFKASQTSGAETKKNAASP